jgi:hypothetical protein
VAFDFKAMFDFLLATGDEWARLRSSASDSSGPSFASLSAAPVLWKASRSLEGARVIRVAAGSAPSPCGDAAPVVAASLGEGVWLSYDGGSTWRNGSPRVPSSRVWSTALSASGWVFAGGEAASLCVSRDAGRNWEIIENLWLVPSSTGWARSAASLRVLDIAVNPHHEDWLLIALEGVGVLFSSDGGFSWDDARPNAPQDTRRVWWHPHAPASALAVSATDAAHSDDGGWSWSALPLPPGKLAAVTADVSGPAVAAPQWLVATAESENAPASTCTQAMKCQLWRGGAAGWELLAPLPAPKSSQDGAEAPQIASVASCPGAIAVGWINGAIHLSLDGGRSWRTVAVLEYPPCALLDLLVVGAVETGKSV